MAAVLLPVMLGTALAGAAFRMAAVPMHFTLLMFMKARAQAMPLYSRHYRK